MDRLQDYLRSDKYLALLLLAMSATLYYLSIRLYYTNVVGFIGASIEHTKIFTIPEFTWSCLQSASFSAAWYGIANLENYRISRIFILIVMLFSYSTGAIIVLLLNVVILLLTAIVVMIVLYLAAKAFATFIEYRNRELKK